MREGMGELGQRLLSATENMESLVETKQLVFCRGCEASSLITMFSKSIKKAFSVQKSVTLSKYFTNYDPLSDFPYYNLTPPPPPIERAPHYPPPGDALESSVGVRPVNLHQYPGISI